ncbi:MAG: phosphoenolpyruvate--protein phosphotransferase [Deltaproteobacteria bacterium]|nr:phosphoenolpyruvate--protein phosphotransferase [Deltaproteobacteria bacterium]
MPHIAVKEIVLGGINASPGVCIGKAYLVDKGVDVISRYPIPKTQVADELKRFKAAVKKSRDELRTIIENTSVDSWQQTSILETQEVLLKDKLLYGKTIAVIEQECINAEWALKKVVTHLRSIFEGMTDPYLRERASDVVNLSDRIMRNLVGVKQVNIGKIDKRVILVARDLSPAETSQIRLEKIKGFVTDKGGKASHTGIIARTLEIPAVVAVGNATTLIKNDDLIILDGINGAVIIHPNEKTLIKYEEMRMRYERQKAAINRSSRLPVETLDGESVKVLGNIELPEEVVSVINYGGDGIGLYRTEFQYMSRPRFPGEDELYDKYSDVIQVMAPKPVTIRTLDINGDKAISAENGFNEANPALGLRGIRYCLQRPEVFRTQLRAILRAAVYGKVRIMFPMVATQREVAQAKKALGEAAASLAKEGVPFSDRLEIGVLIEVPSAVIMADAIAEEADFFSIGTNDLIQYTLAIDRNNKNVAHLFQPLDPAILRMLKHVTDVAGQKKIKVFICGEMASYPVHIPILLGLGIEELSMNPQAIPTIKQMIRSIKISDTKPLVAEALKLRSAEKVFALLRDTYGDILSDFNRTDGGDVRKRGKSAIRRKDAGP